MYKCSSTLEKFQICSPQGEDGEEGKKTGGLLKGLSSKIFGGDTLESREAKLRNLETQIEEGESSVQAAQEELRCEND